MRFVWMAVIPVCVLACGDGAPKVGLEEDAGGSPFPVIEPPTFSAGDDQVLDEGATLTLAPTIPAEIAGIEWAQDAQDAVRLTQLLPAVAAQNLALPAVASDATLHLTLTLTDAAGNSWHDALEVLIRNRVPTLDAGQALSVTETQTFQLAAAVTGADPGQVVWTQVDATAYDVSASLVPGAQQSIPAPAVSADATLMFQATVTDSDGDTATGQVSIAVHNAPPTLGAGADVTVDEGGQVALSATVTGADSSAVTWTQVDGTGHDVSGSLVTGPLQSFAAPNVAAAATLLFEASITDADGDTATDQVSVTVNNVVPTVAVAQASLSGDEGAAVALAVASPNSGLSYTWQQVDASGLTANLSSTTGSAVSATLPAVPQAAGTVALVFRVTAQDADGDTATDDVTVAASSVSPTAVAAVLGNNTGLVLQLDGTGTGTVLSFLWEQTDSSGSSIDLSSVSTQEDPTLSVPSAGVAYSLRLTVTDGDGDTANATVSFALPSAHAGADSSVLDQRSTSLTAAASSDVDGTISAYAWTQVSGPTVSLSGANTASPSFTAPDVTSSEALVFQVTVTDNAGFTGSDSVTITVSNALAVALRDGTKALRFDVEFAPSTGSYWIIPIVGGVDGAPATHAVSGTSQTLTYAIANVATFDWASTQFRVRACSDGNFSGLNCWESPVFSSANGVDAVGFLKPPLSSDFSHDRTMAMSGNGEVLAARAFASGGAQKVVVYENAGAGWSQTAVLSDANSEAGDSFAESLAIDSSGTYLVVGSALEDADSNSLVDGTTSGDNALVDSGAVYVYRRLAPASWALVAYLKAPDRSAGASFGHAVAIGRDNTEHWLAVGAPKASVTVGASTFATAGKVYLYKFQSGTAPTHTETLAESTQPATFDAVTASGQFGANLAMDSTGTRLAAACTGGNRRVYVFQRDDGTYLSEPTNQVPFVLTPPNATTNGGFFSDALHFAPGGNWLAIADRYNSNDARGIGTTEAGATSDGIGTGAVHLYARSTALGNVWAYSRLFKQNPTDPSTSQNVYGRSVFLAEQGANLVLAVGHSEEDLLASGVDGTPTAGAGNPNYGAVHLYKSSDSGATWGYASYLKAPNPGAGDLFGLSMTGNGTGSTLAISAISEDSDTTGVQPAKNEAGANVGAIYLY